ncbi:ion transporter [Caldovatus aquaticus]|uniref:Ion transporter n=1 Tax=Caldovatus aquaticus TaxID=2865671 RepID=A0ABS7F600_9PROT|nr:ion transporter [Caldovatus aquaticus]MBW8271051.1 ion transporter [Caldovatus aquaticus]
MQEALTAADATDESLRGRSARFVTAAPFQRAVIGLILLNAVTLGLETSASVMATWGGALTALDTALLWLFTAELALRIYAFRGRFFRDPWGLFDLAVVGIAWVPATGALSVLRALRVLRVLRLVSLVPSLRTVVEAMLAALPGMGSILLLMALLFYVFAVMATKLYGEAMPERFGALGASFFTMFQLMTLDDWANIVKPAMEHQPLAWMFFLPFIVVSTFVVLNLFIGVIVESIQAVREERESADARAAQAAADSVVAAAHADALQLLGEVRALRQEVAALRACLPAGAPAPADAAPGAGGGGGVVGAGDAA